MSAIDIRVVDDPAAEVADLLVDIACAGGHDRARRRLDAAARVRARRRSSDADWSAATLWLGDERVVPPDDERSNLAHGRRRADSTACPRSAARG